MCADAPVRGQAERRRARSSDAIRLRPPTDELRRRIRAEVGLLPCVSDAELRLPRGRLRVIPGLPVARVRRTVSSRSEPQEGSQVGCWGVAC